MSIIIFFAVLFVLVLVHEWGHFIVAKKTGMRVDEFAIGFPPKLFGIKKGETAYNFNALPIGGYVKIWGENGEDEDGGASVDRSRAFGSRPKWAQALVLVAGVVMNIILAWVLFTATYLIGIPTAVDESVATDAADLYVAGVLADSPAAVLPVGSVIESISYENVTIESPTPSEFTNTVAEAVPNSVEVSYTYADTSEVITLSPVQGLIESEPERYIVGASLSLLEEQKRPFFTAVVDGAKSTWAGLVGIAGGLWSLIAQSFAGEADFSQVAGPVGIVGLVGDAAAFGITALLTFTAIISLNLAVINLLPFPALDGGRLVFVIIEAITGKPIPHEWAGRINVVGFLILMLLMIAVTYNDILRLL